MSKPQRRKGYKAFDPFCKDVVRKALYNRPNGPHMGRLILGRTKLTGLDDKYMSRTGRMKKGYRDAPPDLEKEFECEKRHLAAMQKLIIRDSSKSRRKQSTAQNDDSVKKSTAKKSDSSQKTNDGSDATTVVPKHIKEMAVESGLSIDVCSKYQSEMRRLYAIQRRVGESLSQFERRLSSEAQMAQANVHAEELRPFVEKKKAKKQRAEREIVDRKKAKKRKRRQNLMQRRDLQRGRSKRSNEKGFEGFDQWKPDQVAFGEVAHAPPRLDVPMTKKRRRMKDAQRAERFSSRKTKTNSGKMRKFDKSAKVVASDSRTSSKGTTDAKWKSKAAKKKTELKDAKTTVNIKGLSFANKLIEKRAKEIQSAKIMRNYARMKAKRMEMRLQAALQQQKRKKTKRKFF